MRHLLGSSMALNDAITAPWLGVSPSFMYSGIVPVLYTLVQAGVEYLPSVPTMQFANEGPISFFDALTRAYLLCNLIPPSVVNHTNSAISTSPWTLLLTSFVSLS
jgi:hypothetical protein